MKLSFKRETVKDQVLEEIKNLEEGTEEMEAANELYGELLKDENYNITKGMLIGGAVTLVGTCLGNYLGSKLF